MPALDYFRGHLFHEPNYSPTTPDRLENDVETLMSGSLDLFIWIDRRISPVCEVLKRLGNSHQMIVNTAIIVQKHA